MRLNNSLAKRLLMNDDLAIEIIMSTYPEFDGKEDNPLYDRAGSLASLMKVKGQTAYYITNTVIDKLSMLKIKRGDNRTFDWTVFNCVRDKKVTFIFPDNSVLRMQMQGGVMCFCYLKLTHPINPTHDNLHWVLFYCDTDSGFLSDNFFHEDVVAIDEFVYKLLCFIYLSENDEVEIKSGHRHGTKKSGKVLNELPVPIIIVNSRWNTTVIMKEKFGVRGHFAIRWTGSGRQIARLVFIEPFEKSGYIRKAKNIL